jgi:hypothetical protein
VLPVIQSSSEQSDFAKRRLFLEPNAGMPPLAQNDTEESAFSQYRQQKT